MVDPRTANLPPQYLGQAATNCHVALDGNASFTRAMGRSTHIANDPLVDPVVEYGNYHYKTNGSAFGQVSAPYGATGTLKVGIEYPAGVVTLANECIAAGNTGVPFLAGNNAFTFTGVRIPKRARFWMRVYQVNPGGVIWTGLAGGNTRYGQPADEGFDIGTSDNDKVLTGSIGAGNGINFYPLVIATRKRSPAVLNLGDSRTAGGELNDNGTAVSASLRILDGAVGWTSFAASATFQVGWNTGTHTFLYQLVAKGYWTKLINGYGINDASSVDGDVIVARRAACAAAFKAIKPDLSIIGKTLAPYVGSPDKFVSKATQTYGTNNQRVIRFNAIARRSGIAGEDYLWDEAGGVDPFGENVYPVSPDPSVASRSPASFSATINGTTLTVITFTAGDGTLRAGHPVEDGGVNVPQWTSIVRQLTGTLGSAGTYELNHVFGTGYPYPSNIAAAQTMTTSSWISNDGLHYTPAGVQMVVQRKGAELLAMVYA